MIKNLKKKDFFINKSKVIKIIVRFSYLFMFLVKFLSYSLVITIKTFVETFN